MSICISHGAHGDMAGFGCAVGDGRGETEHSLGGSRQADERGPLVGHEVCRVVRLVEDGEVEGDFFEVSDIGKLLVVGFHLD